MKQFGVDVEYKARVVERTVVTAIDKEDAKRKILEGDCDDVLDSFIETENIFDIDIFQVDEVE